MRTLFTILVCLLLLNTSIAAQTVDCGAPEVLCVFQVVEPPPPVPAGTLLQQTVNAIRQEAREEAAKAEAERIKAEAFRQAVDKEYKKFGIFVAKYVLPLVGGLVSGHFLFGRGAAQ